jgi:hypothetical protein
MYVRKGTVSRGHWDDDAKHYTVKSTIEAKGETLEALEADVRRLTLANTSDGYTDSFGYTHNDVSISWSNSVLKTEEISSSPVDTRRILHG